MANKIVPARSNLVNASGDRMDICGVVTLKIKLKGFEPINQEFKVLNSSTFSNILLGRDFMKRFGSVKLDFKKNQVKLGRKWVRGVAARSEEKVRLAEEVVISARSEQVVTVRCKTVENSLCDGDFVPKQLRAHRGVFVSKARVAPNINGVFQVTILNVTEADIKMQGRTIVGSLHKAADIVAA